MTDFHEWKQTMEKEMKASYVTCKGASKKRNGYSQTFFCNRSGYAKLVPDDKRQRAPQAQGEWGGTGEHCITNYFIQVCIMMSRISFQDALLL